MAFRGRDDPSLTDQVRSLLEASERTEGRIEAAVDAGVDLVTEEPDSGRETIGPYKILRELGRGGLSIVYLAERSDHEFQMRVAIKLVQRGLGTRDILDRLRVERQILANLEHPNIAKLLDGGTTEDGLPYLVMEYIEGEYIDRYCDRRRLSVSERLELFRQLCAAVEYAHRNLVIHRDLKPSNILITEGGVPKLLDFGIAKLLDPALYPENVEATSTQARMLTPAYASPEQVLGQTPTTATDVYSLGMVLYLLLTGRLPYRVEGPAAQVARIVCETEPVRPSLVVGRSEKRRLAGDLDVITLSALRKEPARRYASVAQLSEDVRRHLEGLPVRARRDTFSYRAHKFVRRHLLAVAATALVVTITSALVAFYTWQLKEERDRARANAEQARTNAERASQIRAYLIDLFEISDPNVARGEETTARVILEHGAQRIEALAGQPGRGAAAPNG